MVTLTGISMLPSVRPQAGKSLADGDDFPRRDRFCDLPLVAAASERACSSGEAFASLFAERDGIRRGPHVDDMMKRQSEDDS